MKMKILRGSILVVLNAAGVYIRPSPERSHSRVLLQLCISHPGSSYYYPWASSFGFAGHTDLRVELLPVRYYAPYPAMPTYPSPEKSG